MDIYTAYPRDPKLPQLERGVIIQYQLHEYDAFHHVITYLRQVQKRHGVNDNAIPEIIWDNKRYTATECMQYLDRNAALRHSFKVCFLDLHATMFQTYVTILEAEYQQRRDSFAEENDEPPNYFLTKAVVDHLRQVCRAHFPDRAHMQ
jgi:hypothetical protein